MQGFPARLILYILKALPFYRKNDRIIRIKILIAVYWRPADRRKAGSRSGPSTASGDIMRSCGILLHISSLPGPGPIGTMGGDARKFVDFLHEAGQSVWQVLPLTHPARGNSPYSAYSAFAGNPYLIDLFALEQEELLPRGSLYKLPRSREYANYGVCAALYPKLLRKSFETGWEQKKQAVAAFREENAYWIEDYALFMSLCVQQGHLPFSQWPEPLLLREPAALRRAGEELAEEIAYHCYLQYLFFRQWHALKEYANRREVRIMGDMPIYADIESAEVWAHSEIFQLDSRLRPTRVAGVPPDAFSAGGQLWGNPLYDWDTLKEQGYAWWLRRMESACSLFDIVRIDHFRALESYYAIPAQDTDARGGSWEEGPGIGFLQAVRKALPNASLVAEDLGLLSEEVRQLLRESGLPGMCVLQFAFDPHEQSSYLPHNMQPHCVAYIGTHDTDTALGWLDTAPPAEADFAREYLALTKKEGLHWGFIRGLYASVADTAIVQMQDVLGLGSSARMNVPAAPKDNWRWRLPPGAADEKLAGRLRRFAQIYGRLEREPPPSAELFL